jgi:hypothetical protein
MKYDQLIKMLLFAGLVLLLTSIIRKDRLPGAEEIDISLYSDPIQRQTSLGVFSKEVNDNTYLIQPLYSYELSGLVVSYHASDVWWDIYHHGSWQDFINIKDLCVVWGRNLQTEAYLDMTYDSDNWTCFYMASNQGGADRFRSDQLSNNHLLSDDEEIRELIMGAGIGDQVRLKGQLVNYVNPANNFSRGSSVTRNDTGNGACETIYVENFEVIKKNNPGWRAAYLAGKIIIAASIVLLGLNFLFGDVTSFIKK